MDKFKAAKPNQFWLAWYEFHKAWKATRNPNYIHCGAEYDNPYEENGDGTYGIENVWEDCYFDERGKFHFVFKPDLTYVDDFGNVVSGPSHTSPEPIAEPEPTPILTSPTEPIAEPEPSVEPEPMPISMTSTEFIEEFEKLETPEESQPQESQPTTQPKPKRRPKQNQPNPIPSPTKAQVPPWLQALMDQLTHFQNEVRAAFLSDSKATVEAIASLIHNMIGFSVQLLAKLAIESRDRPAPVETYLSSFMHSPPPQS